MLVYENAPDVKKLLADIVKKLNLSHIDINRIFCVRSYRSKSRSVARIYGFPRIWQFALNMKPFYILEFNSEKYDKLSEEDKIKVLIHELLHIPRNFSGGLRDHGKLVNSRIVNRLYKKYIKAGFSKRRR